MTFNNQEWFSNEVYYHYYLAPLVLYIDPNNGPIKGGQVVIVHGKNFTKSPKIICQFGKYHTLGKFLNTHEIKCITPKTNHPGKVYFRISCHKGIFSGGNIIYTYYENPIISSIHPDCGLIYGSTEIFVKGKYFIKGIKN